MSIEIKVPSPGESITQVQIAKWLVADGDAVEKDQEIVEIDSDKASFPVTTPENGIIKIMALEGETLSVGATIAFIEVSNPSDLPPKPSPPATSNLPTHQLTNLPTHQLSSLPASPLARKIIEEKKIPAAELTATFPGKRITRKDVEAFVSRKLQGEPKVIFAGSRESDRKKMTMLRLKLSERLVNVKKQTAMLTTFNEINMQAALSIKEKYSGIFKERFGVGIGLTSFFTKAVTIALKEFPQINSMIDGDEIVTPRYADIGIAVSAPKGLVVPVLRNTEMMSVAEIEIKIKELAGKARDNKITIDDMKGGTFTITNGGVFGSLMSTPILNPPQSAILGMHKIQERPIAQNGQVVIAPMMYVALSYDHRIIDGRESVSFLVKVKELIEDPVKMLTEGIDPIKLLLDL
ncbi:MAG: 2-oxoglutarate dehydrogenase complex dihydrolipoyllysine-residue succinyltransferase [Bacteroidetes bacterium]|nr:2-oxoglutarate dehydrogenase complex dihydrolipoyllysine-residue succinyltransferase [Bacteroidota bacterium]